MTNIRTANDMGQVFWSEANGKAYSKLAAQPSAGAADYAVGAGDETNVQGQAWSRDTSSPYRSSWTSCEMAIAQHTSAYRYDESGTSATYRTVYTAPAAGEIRIYGTATSFNLGYYINNVFQRYEYYHTYLFNGRAFRLAPGDTVQVGDHDGSGDDMVTADEIHCLFLPDSL